MKIGYARVSTEDQLLDRQIESLKKAGCERIYQEKISSGKLNRPELSRMLDALRENDIVIVVELTRIGRTVSNLISIVERIHSVGAHLISLSEPWMNTKSAQGELLFHIFASFAEFERDLTRQRIRDGLEVARSRGRKGGRPSLPEEKINMALKLYKSKSMTLSEIVKATGVSKATLYRRLQHSGLS